MLTCSLPPPLLLRISEMNMSQKGKESECDECHLAHKFIRAHNSHRRHHDMVTERACRDSHITTLHPGLFSLSTLSRRIVIIQPPYLSTLLLQMSAFNEVPVRAIPQRARKAPRNHPRTNRLGCPLPQYPVRGTSDNSPRAKSILEEEALGQSLLTFL